MLGGLSNHAKISLTVTLLDSRNAASISPLTIFLLDEIGRPDLLRL